MELWFLAHSARQYACERTSLSGLLTLFRWQYEGPDLTLLTFHLNNSEITCSEIIFHADFKLKDSAMNTFAVLQKRKKKKEEKKERKYIPYYKHSISTKKGMVNVKQRHCKV